jgi:hypothetical protein
VTVRASRSAWKVASLPVAVSSTFSSEGTISTSRSASSISTGVTPTPIKPAAVAAAASTSGSLWPRSGGPNAEW